jgi:replicative DNA helicase
MNREEARKIINSKLTSELKKAPEKISGHDSYICPFCGNGSGEDGTGISTRDGKHYTCYKGCFSHSDYLDILKMKHKTERESDIFALYGLEINGERSYVRSECGDDASVRSRGNEGRVSPEKPVVDYTEYFKKCNARAKQTKYFSSRGISEAVVARYLLGYDPDWKHPNAPTAPPTARVIIPTSRNSYLARAIAPDALKQYQKQKVGEVCLFNAKALKNTAISYIFVTEGEFDALSVIEAGGEAIGLGSIANANKFIEAVKAVKPTATLVLSLDNDETGQKAQAVIKERLNYLKVSFFELNICGAYKDPNEALQKDRDGFKSRVNDPACLGEKKAAYMKTQAVKGSLSAFMRTLKDTVNIQAVPTGFTELDKMLDGGLYEGLYVMGAISGIGKTTLCLQMADQIAQSGEDAIIFSLEMTQYQLISKSLSRLTFLANDSKEKNGSSHAYSSRQIMTGAFHGNHGEELMREAQQTYAVYSQNLYVHEGMGTIGVDFIKEAVNKHIDIMGRRPVVIIDYIQILAPSGQKVNDKQNMDKAVQELKKMSMEHKIPVIAVSSFNRWNYQNSANMSSFKESGAIEYSSDVLFGLQFKGMDEQGKNTSRKEDNPKTESWWRNDPRELELKVLKNRSGASGDSVYFYYFPKFNYFKEASQTKSASSARRHV